MTPWTRPQSLGRARCDAQLTARKRQARRCKAHNRRGLPCGNFAVLGAEVCRIHGGAAPKVRHAARLALANDGASRALATMRYRNGVLKMDGRIGPRRADGYGCLPPSRRERYLDARQHADREAAARDPLRRALRECVLGLPADVPA